MRTLIALAAVLSALPATAAEVTANGRVSAVTVYTDRALVTRTVRVQVEAGESTVLVTGLPAALVEDSLSASVKSGPARLVGVELRKKYAPESGDERVRALEREIQKLADQQREVTSRIEVDRKALEFADRLQALEGGAPGKEFGSKPFNPAEWEAAVKFLTNLRTTRMGSIAKAEAENRDLSRTIEAKRRELALIRGGRAGESRTAALLIAAKDGGESSVEVRYVVPGAGWMPGYDARGDVAKKEVELTHFAMVIQQTGESWDDVELALSTARPGLGASMPELPPVFLSSAGLMPRPVVRPRSPRSAMKASAMPSEAPSAMGMAEMAAEPEPPQAGWETAEVESSGVSAVYKLPRRQTVPSGDTPRRVTIAVDKLPAALTYETTPKLSALAFLRAMCKNTTAGAFLGGEVNAFLAGDFLGKSRIETTAPGQELPLQLGADERVKVKRERLVEKARDTWWGKKLVLAQSFRITVENFTGARQTVTVIDQVPVSQEAGIEVRAFKSEPDPTETRVEKGELRWKLELGAGEKRVIEFGYEVVYPEALASQRDAILRRSAGF